MKSVFIFAFRGTGRSKTSPFASEPPLIKLGHVGIAFESSPKTIWGFRPMDDAVAGFADQDALIDYLINRQPLPGTLYDDYAIFVRAAQLSIEGARTEVRQLELILPESDFDALQQTVQQIIDNRTQFQYALPSADPRTNNCVTFPKFIGVPLWDTNGMVNEFMDEMIRRFASRWRP